MAIETINVGTSANDGTGDTLRNAFIKCNNNFNDELVPYNGANSNLNLGLNDLYTNKVYLYDEPNDNYGSVHYTDGNFHIEDSDGHKMLVLEDGFMQIHKTDTIQSNLYTSGLTATRDHYLPDSSGTIATNESIELGVTTQNLNLFEEGGTYTSTIKSIGMSSDWELLAPDSSGTIATEENVNNLITEAIATKQNKLFSLQKANGIVSVTGTFSETQVFKQSFVMNDFTFGVGAYVNGFFINIYSLFTKVGSSSGYTIRVKLSTSSTMPSGTTDQIALFNGTTTNLYAQLVRNFSIIRPTSLGNMQLHGFPFTTSGINDFSVSTTATTSRDVLHGDIYYLYVSVQLTTSTADTLNFVSLKASNV